MEVTLHFFPVFRCFRSFGIQAPKTQSDRICCCLSIFVIAALFAAVVFCQFESLYRLDLSGFTTDIFKFLSVYSTVVWLSLEAIWLKQNYLDTMLLKIDKVTRLQKQLGIDTDVEYKKLAAVFSKRFMTAMTFSFVVTVLEIFEGRLPLIFGNLIFKVPSLLINLKVWQAILHVWIHQFMLLTLRDALRQLNVNLECNAVLKNKKYRAYLIDPYKMLMRLYSLIHDYADLINLYFGHSLFIIVQNNITQSLPFFYWTIRDLYKFDLSTYHYALALSIEQQTMIFLIITSSLIGKDEYFAATIPSVVHKIQLNLDTANDGELDVLMETFSLQVLHQKIVFSAGGFFPINMQIIIMTLTTITQNLVIFVQSMADD